MGRPDIVLLVLDTQRADRLSCYGYTRRTSPCLDQLAEQAVLFSGAITPAQWTVPAHTSLFTGLYPWQHGVQQLNSALAPRIETLAERLSAHGYFTAGFSNNPLLGILNNGLRRGFHYFQNYGGLLTVHRPTRKGHRTTKGPFGHLLRLCLSGLQHAAIHAAPLSRLLHRQPFLPLWHTALSLRGNLKGESRRSLGDAVRLLSERRYLDRGQPLFCFINLMGTHVPFEPPDWSRERFGLRPPAFLPNALWLRIINSRIYGRLGPGSALDSRFRRLVNDLYDAEVTAQDRELGRFLQMLEEAGRLKQTLLIIVSDHGEMLGERGLLGHAFAAYEPLLRVPLLVSDPAVGLSAGKTISDFVSTRRVFHTILAAAGAATGAEAALSVLQERGADKNALAEAVPMHAAIRHFDSCRRDLLRTQGYDRTQRAIYSDRHKLVLGDGRPDVLYAIGSDPNETKNLTQARPEIAEALKRVFWHEYGAETHNDADYAEPDAVLQHRLRALGYGGEDAP